MFKFRYFFNKIEKNIHNPLNSEMLHYIFVSAILNISDLSLDMVYNKRVTYINIRDFFYEP